MGHKGKRPAAADKADHDFGTGNACRRCGTSRTAAAHFGWSCTPAVADSQPAPVEEGTHVFGGGKTCRRCGASRAAIEHFGWSCEPRASMRPGAGAYPRTDEIRKKIDAAVTHEERHGTLTAKLREPIRQAVAKTELKESSPQAMEQLLVHAAVNSYVRQLRQVPELLDEIVAAAEVARIGDEIRPIIEVAQAYFLEEADLIPDNQGLVGLRDDAYLVLTLMQRISLLYEQLSGQALLSVDLTDSIASMMGGLSAGEVAVLNEKATHALANLEATVRALIAYGNTVPVNRYNPRPGPGIDFKREIIRDQIRHDLAKDGIFF
jgi:uncharacterized membrane protein YkvA (DUF1232 family)